MNNFLNVAIIAITGTLTAVLIHKLTTPFDGDWTPMFEGDPIAGWLALLTCVAGALLSVLPKEGYYRGLTDTERKEADHARALKEQGR